MAKDKNLGHAPNDDGVCSQCGLEMAYLLAAKAPCSQKPEVADEPAEE